MLNELKTHTHTHTVRVKGEGMSDAVEGNAMASDAVENNAMAPDAAGRQFHTTEWIERCLASPLIPQRSDEWFRMRKTRITGSMCDTLVGSNPFQTWDQLVCEKAGMPVEFKGNAATQHGIDNEDKAIRLYEKETGRVVRELGLTQHRTIDILAHSPDGISLKAVGSDATGGDAPVLLEVKCPFRRQIKRGKVPKYYMGQLQLGLFVFDLRVAHFVQYTEDPYVLDITVVDRDEGWLAANMPHFERFWDEVEFWKRVGWKRHPFYQRHSRQEMLAALPRPILGGSAVAARPPTPS